MKNNDWGKRVLRFFVSSVDTLMDEEKKTIHDIVYNNGDMPVAMDGFCGSSNLTSFQVVVESLKMADVFIVVLGFFYGSIIGKQNQCNNCLVSKFCPKYKRGRNRECTISFTHFEYLYAVKEKIRCYCIIQADIGEASFESRLKREHLEESELTRLRGYYYQGYDQQKELIDYIGSNFRYTYDANDTKKEIPRQLGEIFPKIERDLNDAEIFGLIEEKAARDLLNQKEKELRKAFGQKQELESKKADLEHQLEVVNARYEEAKEYRRPTTRGTTAVTGTCIPFKYDEKKNVIVTYLIRNEAYKSKECWMFPGGHTFMVDDRPQSPEEVAKKKAKSEAHLVVETIDLYKCFNSAVDEDNFQTYKPPHYSYLFRQNESADCFKQHNHWFHYDAVYVCEIKEDLLINDREDNHPQTRDLTSGRPFRCIIELPNYTPTYMSTKAAVTSALRIINFEEESVGEYVIKMLYEAYKDYVIYLKEFTNEDDYETFLHNLNLEENLKDD